MYIRIYYNKIFAIASDIINLRSREDGIEIDPQYFTDITFEDAISLYEFDVNDFMIYDTIIPTHLKNSDLREIETEKSRLDLIEEEIIKIKEEIEKLKEEKDK